MYKFINLFLIIIIFSSALFIENAVAESDKKLARFSISIRGGASKGAYEAGLNWSLLKLSRYDSDFNVSTEGESFQFDLESISGASAGGINTLLSGMTWCSLPEDKGGITNRSNDNIFRDIWLRVDINTLLPEKADATAYLNDDAVLSRKDFLEAAGKIRDKWNQPFFRHGCHVPLGVTVTRIEPDELMVGNIEVNNQRFYIPFELRVKADNSIDFFFDPHDYPRMADPSMILMPWKKGESAYSIDDQRIENVSFTTSAYPMAFGRKRLQYCKLITHDITDETPIKLLVTKLDKDLICADGYELSEAEFSDGGLFDNLPIGLARVLAENSIQAENNTHPVTYLYLDPNQIRYTIPKHQQNLACDSDKPPVACRTMEFSFASEGQMLINAMGTARTYELYRELTSDNWQLNLSEISYKLSRILKQRGMNHSCEKSLPFFDHALSCAEALNRAGHLLEIAYEYKKPVIKLPYSYKRLRQGGVTKQCERLKNKTDSKNDYKCVFEILRYRMLLADAMKQILKQEKLDNTKLYTDIEISRRDMNNDRSLRVSSRGAPITGTLLGSFGSFLDYKFREYDYYVGIYDAVIMTAKNLCDLRYSTVYQLDDYKQCFDSVSKRLYAAMGLMDDHRGRYVFAMLAQREYGEKQQLTFAYQPAPHKDRDMQQINEALSRALEAGEDAEIFFEYLKAVKFKPSQSSGDTKAMLSLILDDPGKWETELVRRVTSRMVYLETQAEKIYKAREPDPAKQKNANTELMGAGAYLLQGATYRNPEFTFSPSTAPVDWFWRNIIPLEIGFETVEGDILFTWQPTVAMNSNDLIGLRANLGFAGGLFTSSNDIERENYLTLGLNYTRKTTHPIVSSYGFTPFWYHNLIEPEAGKQDSLGTEIHVNLLKDRLRVGLGVNNINDASNSFFITISVIDIPGMVYWLTR